LGTAAFGGLDARVVSAGEGVFCLEYMLGFR